MVHQLVMLIPPGNIVMSNNDYPSGLSADRWWQVSRLVSFLNIPSPIRRLPLSPT